MIYSYTIQCFMYSIFILFYLSLGVCVCIQGHVKEEKYNFYDIRVIGISFGCGWCMVAAAMDEDGI